jgi:hypothetical protein
MSHGFGDRRIHSMIESDKSAVAAGSEGIHQLRRGTR